MTHLGTPRVCCKQEAIMGCGALGVLARANFRIYAH
jgi:hypothetical protein